MDPRTVANHKIPAGNILFNANRLMECGDYKRALDLFKEISLSNSFYNKIAKPNIELLEEKVRLQEGYQRQNLSRELLNALDCLNAKLKKLTVNCQPNPSDKSFIIDHRIEQKDWKGIKGWITLDQNIDVKEYSVGVKLRESYIAISNTYTRNDVQKLRGKPAIGYFIKIPDHYLTGTELKIELDLLDEANQIASNFSTVKLTQTSEWNANKKEDKNRPRLLFSSHNLKIQGAQTSLYQLARGLSGSYEIYICSPVDGPLRKLYESQGFKVIICENFLPKKNQTFDEWCELLNRLGGGIKALAPVCVLANTLQSINVALAAKASFVNAVLVPRESEPIQNYFDGFEPKIRAFYDGVHNVVDEIIFVAQTTRETWLDKLLPNAKVIPNGLFEDDLVSRLINRSYGGLRRFYSYSEDEKILLCVGTVCERKGQLDLVRSFSKLRECSNQKLRLVLIGMNESAYARDILSFINNLSIELKDDISLIHETSEEDDQIVVDHYLMSDFFVLASYYESYPRVVLEALFFGLPVVSTRCFGTLEQIEDEVSGFFYDAGNVPALATCLKRVSSDSILAELKMNVPTCYKKLVGYEDMLSEYHAVINKLVSKKNDLNSHDIAFE